MSNSLGQGFEKATQIYLKSCKTLQNRITKKAVHVLRISTKRITAMLQFVEFISKKKNRGGELKKIKKVFKSAGNIRNRQIALELLGEIKELHCADVLQMIKSDDKNDKVRLKKRLIHHLPGREFHSINKTIKAITGEHTTAELWNQAILFTKNELMNALIKGDKKDYHKARIRLKTVHHVMEIFKRHKKAKIIISWIDPLESELGDWHDRVILLESLTKMLSEARAIDPELKKAILGVKRSLAKQEKQLNRDFKVLSKNLSNTMLFTEKKF